MTRPSAEPTAPAEWLRWRAESYARDAVQLRADGETDAAPMYETIAEELRACAAQMSQLHRMTLLGDLARRLLLAAALLVGLAAGGWLTAGAVTTAPTGAGP